MVEVFGAGTAVYFSSKDLGLNAGLSGLFSNSPELDYETDFRTMCTVLCVLLKVNNMCLCENHVVICSIEVLA